MQPFLIVKRTKKDKVEFEEYPIVSFHYETFPYVFVEGGKTFAIGKKTLSFSELHTWIEWK